MVLLTYIILGLRNVTLSVERLIVFSTGPSFTSSLPTLQEPATHSSKHVLKLSLFFFTFIIALHSLSSTEIHSMVL